MPPVAKVRGMEMRRYFEQRDLLSSLLSAPTASDNSQHNLGRLTMHLSNGNIAQIHAYELKSILSALVDECKCDLHSEISGDINNNTIDSEGSEGMMSPRKKAKRAPSNNNLHSILKFVQRVIYQRYNEKDMEEKCSNNDEDDKIFLDNELKSHFGTNDTLFQIEEDILCLAFELAVNAVMQRSEDLKSSNKMKNHGDDVLCENVITTALQIIDSVVDINRHERATRRQLYQTRHETKPSPSHAAAKVSRRKKYEHLLQPTKKCKAASTTTKKVMSVMEEKYPQQWKWLCQFRTGANDTNIESMDECTSGEELQQVHYSSKPSADEIDTMRDDKASNAETKTTNRDSNFVIIRRRIETLDDISLSSDDSDEEMNQEIDNADAKSQDKPMCESAAQLEPKISATDNENVLLPTPASPYEKLDQETSELRLTLLDMPPNEASSTEVVRHTVEQITNLLGRYGEVDGAAGIARCGDIFGGQRMVELSTPPDHRFPLNDAMVASLLKELLTDATGSLRAKAFLRAFALPLMVEMNPTVKMARDGSSATPKTQSKSASRVLTSLLTTIARDRPTECVVSVIVPTLVLRKYIMPSSTAASEVVFEPTRFQCELISRILKGKDALSSQALALLVEQLLPDAGAGACGGMKWTENTMPVLAACLNRHPKLADDVVSKLADEISYHLLSSASTAPMVKSMKMSTLFHAFVSKYGAQVKSTGKVDSLKESATRLKTFMSKTIGVALKKLS